MLVIAKVTKLLSSMCARTLAASKLRTAHLKASTRVALNPQETKNVIFHISQSQLAVWNAESKWKVEPGSYTLWVGGSSQASLTTKFALNPR